VLDGRNANRCCGGSFLEDIAFWPIAEAEKLVLREFAWAA